MTLQFTCDSCGAPFAATRTDALTCSGACRQRRQRERKAARAVGAAVELATVPGRRHVARAASALQIPREFARQLLALDGDARVDLIRDVLARHSAAQTPAP
jgi:hypothetical protein